MISVVYVLSKSGSPLMPTTRCCHVRILLKEGRARVVERKPFTIQLTYETSEAVQPLTLGIDPGRTNIGLSVVTDTGRCVFHAEAVTRNKDIPKLMSARKTFRQKHRRLNRRCKRQRRAVSYKTIRADVFERKLPGCERPIVCHGIKNKEARFNNRKRPDGWLTPTANQLLQTHVNLVKRIQKLLPITSIVLESNKFAFMAMDNPAIRRWEYQRGALYHLGCVENAVAEDQNGHCMFCGSPIEHCHHIIPRSRGGSDTLPNRVGLCQEHHMLVHTDKAWEDKLKVAKAGLNKKYGALSVLNQIIPALTSQLSQILPTFVTNGRSTKAFRDAYAVEKRHSLDAYCIACSVVKPMNVYLPEYDPLIIRQFRRHDRQACHKENLSRRYVDMDGRTVAINRHKAIEQNDDSLAEYVKSGGSVSGLLVKQHLPVYKDMRRWMPGSLVSFDGNIGVLQSSQGRYKGQVQYYISTSDKKTLARKCNLIKNNRGLLIT